MNRIIVSRIVVNRIVVRHVGLAYLDWCREEKGEIVELRVAVGELKDGESQSGRRMKNHLVPGDEGKGHVCFYS
jgi:hypothetical protein